MGKVFEKLVQAQIYFQFKSLFDTNQHGFLPGRSTTSNLLDYVTTIYESMEDKAEVHAIYTDFSKAFDLVDHGILLQKLAHAGICGSLLRWCESYLKNRSQLVKIRGYNSDIKVVPCGVPQGSHLGPLFFLFYVNDLCSVIASGYQMFADDLKVYRKINDHRDISLLQHDVNAIKHWCSANGMLLNSSKCFHIKFTRKRDPIAATYYISNDPIAEISTIRDLGVVLDSKLDFRDHIDGIIKKGTRLAGFVIRQTKFFNDCEIPIILYNCYVRAILEYCCQIWCPSYAVHIARIEKLQKQFLYHLSYAHNLCQKLPSYESRLQYFKLTTLENRRQIADIVYLSKLVNGKLDAPSLTSKLQFAVPRPGSRLHNIKTFSLSLSRTKYCQHSPLYRMCSAYNSVSNDIDIFSASIRCLKLDLLQK